MVVEGFFNEVLEAVGEAAVWIKIQWAPVENSLARSSSGWKEFRKLLWVV